MSLSEAAQRVGYVKPDPRCTFGAIVDGFDADDRAFLDQMVADGAPATAIVKVLRAADHKTSATTVKDHFRGDCSCPR